MLNTRLFRTLVHLLVILGIVVVFIYYLYNNIDRYTDLLNISKIGVVGLFVLSLTFPMLNGMQNTYLYRGLGMVGFSHWDGFLVTAASTLANQLPIPGGIMSKGYYLKRRYDLSYTEFASSTIATFFCFIAVNGVMGITVLLYWMVFKDFYVPFVLLIAFVGMVAVSVLIFKLPIERIPMPHRLRRLMHQTIEGWMTIGEKTGLLFRLAILQAALVILLSFRYWIVFHMLSQNVSLSQCLLFASASILTQLVSIAPGGLGVREAIVAAMAALLGFDAATSVVAISLDRLVITFMIILTGWISTAILGKQISDMSVEQA